MQRDKLETFLDQLEGANSDAPNGRNLAAAGRELLRKYDEAQEYDTTPSDAQWSEAHEDFQYLLARVLNLGIALAGEDGALEDDQGNVLADLPHAATSTDSSASIPSDPGGGA